MILIYLFIFVISVIFLVLSSRWLIYSLIDIAHYLGWKEFVMAFITMALASSLSNIFVGISSVIHRIPELSFSEISGGNIVDLTIAIGIAALISRTGLNLPSQTVQSSAIFVIIAAFLPLALSLDGEISRLDGCVFILAFICYLIWLFSKRERFAKTYNNYQFSGAFFEFKKYIKGFARLFAGVVVLVASAEGIIRSALYFSEYFNAPLILVGILIIGLGNSLPEIFFGIQAARKGEDWLVVGDLMGAMIIPATLVLGVVALFSPIKLENLFPLIFVRIFLMLTAIIFLIFIRTGKKITKKEAIFLILLYGLFIVIELKLF